MAKKTKSTPKPITATAAAVEKSKTIVTETPTVEPIVVTEIPAIGSIPEPVSEHPKVVKLEEAHNIDEQVQDPELYTIHAADLNAYPELSQQKVQLHDQVRYGSLYVWKKATADGDDVVPEPWPRATGAEKIRGISFSE